MKWILGIYALILAINLVILGCEPVEKQVIETRKAFIRVPGEAYMDGRDRNASATLMRINIWDDVPRSRPVCEIAHGEEVRVLEAKLYEPEERYYFKVRSGSCVGWVSEPFLSVEKHPPIGDRFKTGAR